MKVTTKLLVYLICIDVLNEEKQTVQLSSDVPVKVVQLYKSFQKYPWKTNKDLKAVNGISFSVQKGEIFCLLGPNGAGKTTTINMLTGVLSPDDGDSGGATVMGYDIHSEMDGM
jgi:ABC-type multidrug transport system ATPase subunit